MGRAAGETGAVPSGSMSSGEPARPAVTPPAPTSAAPPTGVRLWVAGARPRTLPASVVPVVVGTACAAGRVEVAAWRAVAAMVVALALQVATNYANDYSDGVRGTDAAERRVGPLRLVGSGLVPPGAVKRAAVVAFAVAGLAGLALAAAVGWELVAVGAAAMAAGWFYTGGPRPYGYLGLGELFVFAFFGVVATAGSAYVQEEALSGLALAASVPVGFLATALLVVNNLRDIPGDTASGKNTLAVRLGDAHTRWLYAGLVAVALAAVVPIALVGERPWALVALVAVALAVEPVRAVQRGACGPALIPVLVATGRLQLAFGALLSLGLWASG
jgi:1,4-dihydroxy-2-naphthoate polyprenyltransferase